MSAVPPAACGVITGGKWLEPSTLPPPDIKPVPPTLPDQALYFSGATAVDIGNPAKLDITGTITIMAWIRPDTIDGTQIIVGRGNEGNPKNEVFLRLVDTFYEVASSTGTAAGVRAPTSAADRGAWVHLAGVCDGKNWYLYQNGKCIATKAQAQGAIRSVGWAIGAGSPPIDRFFRGFIRRVAIWRTALSANDIVRNMNVIDPSQSGLAAYWPLDDGQGTVARDLVTVAPANGIIKGGVWVKSPV